MHPQSIFKFIQVLCLSRLLIFKFYPFLFMFLAYTIRTETSIRTSEIKFYIDQTFSETTIDGRITDTTPIRNEHVITLIQKGNANRKEKDTQMVREFVRSNKELKDEPFDLMLLTMKVDDIVCKRVYTRIVDEC